MLWNISSCETLKSSIIDCALNVLSEKVIVNYVSKIEPERMAKFTNGGITDSDSVYDYGISDYAVDPEWATLFMNATGCLR